MIKEIKYNGYTANPSDYECADGDLATSMGLVPEDNALKPVLLPSVVMELEEGEAVKLIHATASYTHYIVYDSISRKAYSIDKGTKTRLAIGPVPYQFSHFNAIGNTLLAFTSNGIYYYLWKNNEYVELGNHIPDVEVSFGLVGHPRLFSLSDESKSTFSISFDSISETTIYNEFSETNKTKITDQVMAKVNKFVAQETVNKGRFCFPFFVRYALRLFDGSLVCHSAPILMNPSTKAAPIVFWKRGLGRGSYATADCDIMLVAATLDYRVIRNYDSYILDDWSDIVKSIEVFVSKPIYTYDQDGKVRSFADADKYNTKFVGRLYADNPDTDVWSRKEDSLIGTFSSKEFLNHYCEWDYGRIYAMYYSEDRTYPITTFHLPEFSDGKVTETLQNTSTFYKLCSIEMTDALADNNRKDIIVDDEYLQSLVTREAMTDDYLTHDQLYADYSFMYNSRVNLAGLRRKPFSGFLAQSMFAFCDRRYNWQHNGAELDISIVTFADDSYKMEVYIKENGEDYVVSCETIHYDLCHLEAFNSSEQTVTDNKGNTSTQMSRHSWGCYFFYPNANAYKMVVYNYGTACYAVDLKAHEFLNGAYAIIGYELVREKNFTSLPSVSTGYPSGIASTFPIEIQDKIYTSEVNNPFFFPLLGINTVGTGNIIGISAAAKALSQGQFGQFPLYAFTTEGVWALEVSATGNYSARQPISRDVCVNPESITQIDTAVLFATDRGIMQISGSNVQCLSDSLKAEEASLPTCLPGLEKLVGMINGKCADDKDKITTEDLRLMPFGTFIKQCRIIYDYVNQRIIVFNPIATYAYVLSIKTLAWGMLRSRLTESVNAYPEALAMQETRLVNLSQSEATDTTALLLTRPFKMGEPDSLKTVDTIIQRGAFKKDHVAQVLYGSNDLVNWHTVWSSKDKYLRGFRGTPYKTFRLALVCQLDKEESIYGFTVQYKERRANKPR